MGEVADQLERSTITVSSPDGGIEAQVRGTQVRSLRFREGAYRRYSEPELAHQLARTATLLFVGRDRAVQEIMEKAGLDRPRRPSDAIDEAQRRYLAALPEIYATGLGPRELVRLDATGLMHWHCEIAQGTLRHLSESEFLAEVMGAGQALLRNHRYETALLRNEHFGSDFGEATRERMRRRASAS